MIARLPKVIIADVYLFIIIGAHPDLRMISATINADFGLVLSSPQFSSLLNAANIIDALYKHDQFRQSE
jgi:MinD-like ATPase involved in chromosome partitioning or flagellar assembly